MRKILTTAMGIFLTFSMLSLTTRADQPYMRAAKKNLEDATKYLKKASADKGGHRQRAMDLVARAKNSVNDGISYDQQRPNERKRKNFAENENNFAEADTDVSFDQKNMQKAKNYLEAALANLNRASADKGGHRVQAINLVRDAIEEVERGIEYERTH